MNLTKIIDNKLFRLITEASVALGQESYIIGGYVRDMMLGNPGKDIDVVTVGSGIDLAQKVAGMIGKGVKVTVYRNFGTAMIRYSDYIVEFVGARKESYRKNSRKPAVEDGTLKDDQLRRDFTINALGISLNPADFGAMNDPFNGLMDLHNKIIRTPGDPMTTFSDDPLRMLRAIRFSAQLGFEIEENTLQAISLNRERMGILSQERVAEELNKIMMTQKPSIAFILLEVTGLLQLILPELSAMKGVEVINNIKHKDNFFHSLEVLDNIAGETDNIWLRWSALLHDIAKPLTKKFSIETGWSFHGHEHIGSRMVYSIFKRLKLPLNEPLKLVQKMVLLHLRPIALVESYVTDSAIRRLLFEAGDDIDNLMMLCKADITSKNQYKKNRYRNNFELVERKLVEIEEKDKLRNWQPPITGEIIMKTFGLEPSKTVGQIKNVIREAILEGIIPNEYNAAFDLMIEEGKKLGLQHGNE